MRAFRPDADGVAVHAEGHDATALERIDDAGLFEGEIVGATLPLRYELEVSYADATYTLRDPYAFMPTLGELDLHLAGRAATRSSTRSSARTSAARRRGRHRVRGLGAERALRERRRRLQRWDGRLHPMRSLGSSGIWELFVPDVGEGAALQVRDPHRGRRPAAQGRPVRVRDRAAAEDRVGGPQPEHVWADDAWMERAPAARAARARRSRSTRCTSARGGCDPRRATAR